jgi:hypothetical protein
MTLVLGFDPVAVSYELTVNSEMNLVVSHSKLVLIWGS